MSNTLVEVVAAALVVAALGFVVAAHPPQPRPKPEPPPPAVVFEIPPTIAAPPMTKQQKVDELERKLGKAEDDLAEISKIIEKKNAEEAAKKLDKAEDRVTE